VLKAEADEHGVSITIRPGLEGTPKPIPAALALWGLNGDAGDFELCKTETILEKTP
jgi:hypothetical protein